jgi:hypothetical protein
MGRTVTLPADGGGVRLRRRMEKRPRRSRAVAPDSAQNFSHFGLGG